ncbi:uncharacterized protein LOC143453056 [Clavelina lepadiformis]|uniref:uncharacterized protein LOC143453056 n=1 Tax=Clavelina lepadiformis TaxID=159417 RepID=UPI0040425BD6
MKESVANLRRLATQIYQLLGLATTKTPSMRSGGDFVHNEVDLPQPPPPPAPWRKFCFYKSDQGKGGLNFKQPIVRLSKINNYIFTTYFENLRKKVPAIATPKPQKLLGDTKS